MIVDDLAAWGLVVALLLDRFVIDPDRLWARLPHPVVGFGWIIDTLEAKMRRTFEDRPNREWERWAGIVVVIVLLTISIAFATAIAVVPIVGPWLAAVVAAILLAQRSLHAHVERVAGGLESDLADGRREVSMIVGRDVSQLDEAEVSRAAIESLAENFSDGIVAPAFWYLLLGLPGIIAYKAINTADSMIGHRNERYERFGWASARLDDLLNLIPARLTALLVAIVGRRPGASILASFRDAQTHASPNAGWPEAAMAGALDIALGGPRRYGDRDVAAPFMNESGCKGLTANDIRSALGVYRRALWLLLALVVAFALGTGDQAQHMFHHA